MPARSRVHAIKRGYMTAQDQNKDISESLLGEESIKHDRNTAAAHHICA